MISALEIGVKIEEMDIADIERMLEETDKDIICFSDPTSNYTPEMFNRRCNRWNGIIYETIEHPRPTSYPLLIDS